MKQVKIVIHEHSINSVRVIGSNLNLALSDEANLTDALTEVDKLVSDQSNFPVPDYRSPHHMVCNPVENRFYEQVAVAAHGEQSNVLNVRDNPEKMFLEGVTISDSSWGLRKRVGRFCGFRGISETK